MIKFGIVKLMACKNRVLTQKSRSSYIILAYSLSTFLMRPHHALYTLCHSVPLVQCTGSQTLQVLVALVEKQIEKGSVKVHDVEIRIIIM